jgi:uncharacterized integral membrane protein
VRLLYWLVTAVAALILAAFAISNLHRVELDFPLLAAPVEPPLYLVVLLALLVGFVAGYLVAWNYGRRHRRAARRHGRRVAALERELTTPRPAAGNGPALPPSRTAAPRN